MFYATNTKAGQKTMVKNQALADMEKKLWLAADKLRANMDAAQYKDIVLGLIFLKYISDRFDEFRGKLKSHFTNPNHEYHIPDASQEEIEMALEDRDYYKSKNVFWVPAPARWHGNKIMGEKGIQDKAKQSNIGQIIDDAMRAIERENPKLKNILPKIFTQRGANIRLGELIDLISTIGFKSADHHATDILGHVYEYFLGQFASAEGKRGGQFYTPRSVVNLIVECLEPYQGRVYDPAVGSGGFFVSSHRFIESHADRKHVEKARRQISLYGQESNPTTWRLSAMNMAIRGIEVNLGRGPADTFTDNQHLDLKADFVMANPPFNMSDWGGRQLTDDRRWKYGMPPSGNANFAWLEHIVHHLSPRGYAGVVLANGSMSSHVNNEGVIRKNFLEADLVDCMIALPGQLFFNTQIPACIWIMARDKSGKKDGKCDRRNKVLFIDARGMGGMISRSQRAFSGEEISKLAGIYHSWRDKGKGYEDQAGLCKSVTLDEIRSHDYVLTPGRYVGIAEAKGDDMPFHEKMEGLSKGLRNSLVESRRLEKQIKANLAGIGFKIDL